MAESKFWEIGTGRTGWSKSGQFGTQAEHVRMQARLKGAGWAIDYVDDITPGAMAFDAMLDGGILQAAKELGPIMGEQIQEIYDKGGEPPWKPVSPAWLRYKANAGFDLRTMHMTGALEANVHELDKTLRSNYNPKTGLLTIHGFDTAFDGTEYVWYHELVGVGTARTRRPFIIQGVVNSMRALAMVTTFIARVGDRLAEQAPPFIIDIVKPPPGGAPVGAIKQSMNAALAGQLTIVGSPKARSRQVSARFMAASSKRGIPRNLAADVLQQYAWHQTKFHTSLISLIWWVLPPSKMLAVYGASMDALAFSTGELLTPRFLSAWATAYFKGKVGGAAGIATTEKMLRRGVRRRIWRGRG